MTKKVTKELNIFQRINAVMGDVEYVKKGEKAAKGLQYNFVSHDMVMGKVRGPMQKHGIAMITDLLELNQNGNRTESKIAISFVNIDRPDDRFTVHFWGHGVDNQDKGVGKSVSYAVKYCLLKTFCLETGDDPERDNIDHIPDEQTTISTKQLQNLEFTINGYDDIRDIILSKCKGNLSNLTTTQYASALKWVENTISERRHV